MPNSTKPNISEISPKEFAKLVSSLHQDFCRIAKKLERLGFTSAQTQIGKAHRSFVRETFDYIKKLH